MCRRQRLFIKSDYCIHGLIKEKKTKTTQIQNKTKQKKRSKQRIEVPNYPIQPL